MGFDLLAIQAWDDLGGEGQMVAIIVAALALFWLWDQVSHRHNTHPCPRCGRRIANGKSSCSCGYDFDKA